MNIRAASAMVGLALAVSACSDAAPATTTTVAPATTQATTTTTTTTSTTTTTIPPTTTTTRPPTTTTTSTTTTTIVDAAPDGFFTASSADLEFSIALRDDYVVIDLTTEDLEELFEDAPVDNEVLDLAVQALLGSDDSFLMWAFDFTNATFEFAPNMNVIRMERTPFDRIDILIDALPTVYEQAGGEVILIERLDVDAGAALIAEAFIDFGDGTGSYAIQLFLLGDDYSYTVTFSFLNDASDNERDATLASFRSIQIND